MPRRYEMSSRTEAMRLTRERILDAAVELFAPAWFDEVTLADVAAAAGVSQQTVVNHFGSKAELFLTGVRERWRTDAVAVRDRAKVGDVRSIVAAVVEGYEADGESSYRTQVLADRLPELRELVDGGRAYHRGFVDRVFAPQLAALPRAARAQTARLLCAVLEVKLWRELRHGAELSPAQTRTHLEALVAGILDPARPADPAPH